MQRRCWRQREIELIAELYGNRTTKVTLIAKATRSSVSAVQALMWREGVHRQPTRLRLPNGRYIHRPGTPCGFASCDATKEKQ
jgi:hypothetical protein